MKPSKDVSHETTPIEHKVAVSYAQLHQPAIIPGQMNTVTTLTVGEKEKQFASLTWNANLGALEVETKTATCLIPFANVASAKILE